MGIEDFDIDSDADRENILVVSANEQWAQELGVLLEKREYRWSFVESLPKASESAAAERIDLLINARLWDLNNRFKEELKEFSGGRLLKDDNTLIGLERVA